MKKPPRLRRTVPVCVRNVLDSLSKSAKNSLYEVFLDVSGSDDRPGSELLDHEIQLINACHLQDVVRGYLPKLTPKYDVFLGGACNPTTWRTDYAVPILESHGISYFNPQVQEWHEELVEIESEAKLTSLIFLFVFETWSTRATSSFIEAASLIGRNARIVFAIRNTSDCIPPMINDEKLSDREFNGLQNALQYLRHIAALRGIPVFDDTKEAVNHVVNLVFEERKAKSHIHLCEEEFSLVERVSSVCRVFRSLEKFRPNCVSVREARLGLQKLGLDLPCVQSNWRPSQGITFPHFCRAYATYVHEHHGGLAELDAVSQHVQSCNFNFDLYLNATEISNYTEPDLTLLRHLRSSTCGLKSRSTNLRIRGVPSHQCRMAEDIRFSEWARAHGRLLLFYISANSFSLRTMMEASLAISSGQKVVVCIESIGDYVWTADVANRSPSSPTYNRTPIKRFYSMQENKLRFSLYRAFIKSPSIHSPLNVSSSPSSESNTTAGTSFDWSTGSSPLDESQPSKQLTVDSGIGSERSQSSSPEQPIQLNSSLPKTNLSSSFSITESPLPSKPGSDLVILPISNRIKNDYDRARRYLRSVCDDHHVTVSQNLEDVLNTCRFRLLLMSSCTSS